jgi:hypothetical protein
VLYIDPHTGVLDPTAACTALGAEAGLLPLLPKNLEPPPQPQLNTNNANNVNVNEEEEEEGIGYTMGKQSVTDGVANMNIKGEKEEEEGLHRGYTMVIQSEEEEEEEGTAEDNAGMEAAARRLARGLVAAVASAAAHSRASPARPMGVLFSGGVDSTGILAICLRMGVPCVVGLYKLNSVYP